MEKHIIEIDTIKCIGCSMCVRDCPNNNISTIGKKAQVNSQSCIKCGHCVAICPVEAITITGFHEQPIEFDKQPTVDPQQLLEALQARRSIRQFTDQAVPTDVLEKIIEAGRWTPTAKNASSVSYLVLKDEKYGLKHWQLAFLRYYFQWLSYFIQLQREWRLTMHSSSKVHLLSFQFYLRIK